MGQQHQGGVCTRAWLGVFLIFIFTLGFAAKNAEATEPEPELCGEQSVNVCIMLDRTGSVSSSERTNEATAAKNLVDLIATLDNGTRVAIGRFGDNSNGGLEAEIVRNIDAVTPQNAASFKTSIDNALSSGSSVGTNVRDAINVCQTHLVDNSNGKQNILIMISDFDPNEPGTCSPAGSSNCPTADTAALTAATNAKNAGTRIFSIGFATSGANSADEANRTLGASIGSGNSSDNHCTASSCNSTQRAAENSDGDDWFLAPMANDLNAIFQDIFEVLQCQDDGNPCTVESCNQQGLCVSDFIPDCKPCSEDRDCDDGNACNGEETCGEDDRCDSGTPLVCNDDNLCTSDSCDPESGCEFTPKTCNDGMECSIDSCNPSTGECSFDTANCECLVDGDCNDGNACTDDSCEAGECVHTNDDTNSCDDGLFCNGTESCEAGECRHSGDPCATGGECADNCDEATDSCNDPAGTSCDDNDGNVCTDGECNGAGLCLATHNESECDDGNPCTLDDVCSGGACGGTPKSCDDGVSCTPDSCNESTGACEHPTSECECVTDADCNDNNECTDEFCNDQNQCVRSDNSDPCDDGLFCNGPDTCGGGTCSIHSGDPCGEGGECADDCNEETDSCNAAQGTPCGDDGNACTDNECDGEGACVPLDNENGCDDGDPCTLDDTCSEGECNPGTPKDCSDGRSCSVDSCNSETGACEHDLGSCECSVDGDCNDGNPCTVDSCNVGTGTCNNSPDVGALCDDGNACTIDDLCDESGSCGGVTLGCADGDVCTEDSCDPQSGCVFEEIPACGDSDPSPDPTPSGDPQENSGDDSQIGGGEAGGPGGGNGIFVVEGSGCSLQSGVPGKPEAWFLLFSLTGMVLLGRILTSRIQGPAIVSKAVNRPKRG